MKKYGISKDNNNSFYDEKSERYISYGSALANYMVRDRKAKGIAYGSYELRSQQEKEFNELFNTQAKTAF